MPNLENASRGVNSVKVKIMRQVNKFILLVVVFGSGLLFSSLASAEIGLLGYDNITKNITRLDKKKKWIQFSTKKFAYNGQTKITDFHGNTVAEDVLRKGIFVTIKLDVSQRYISNPVLSEIHIESDLNK